MKLALPASMMMPLLVLCGCQRVTSDMARQARSNADSASPLFTDQQAVRPPARGGVAHASGDLAQLSSGRLGLAVQAPATQTAGEADIQRGKARYEIFCMPCHGEHGEGDGEVVRRGFPKPQPFGLAALRAAPDAQLQAAIREGAGVMGPFADRVSEADAQAIVAYLRLLQTQNAGSAK